MNIPNEFNLLKIRLNIKMLVELAKKIFDTNDYR